MKMTSMFKKASVFAVAIILALLMVVAVLPTVFAADVTPQDHGEKLVASNISISGDITMLYYFTGIDDANYSENDFVRVTVPTKSGGTKSIDTKIGDLETNEKGGTTRWVVPVSVAYAQQTDEFTIQFYKGNVPGKVRTRTVKAYADQVLSFAAEGKAAYKAIATPISNMLNVGAMAQLAFGYNVENLANAGAFSGDSNPADSMLPKHFYDVIANPAPDYDDSVSDKVTFTGGSIELESKISLRIYLTCSDDITTAQVTDGTTTLTVYIREDSLGNKYVSIHNILASNFSQRFTVTVDGESFSYSVLDYAYDTVNSYIADEAQKNLAKSLYLFYTYTKAHVDNNYTPGPADCTHVRSHIENGVITCSDCGKTIDGATLKISVKAAAEDKLYVNTEGKVKLTFAINGSANISSIVFTPKCSDPNVTLTLDKVEWATGYDGGYNQLDLNCVLIGEQNSTVTYGTFATATYTVNATEAGTYTVSLVVRDVTEGTEKINDTSFIVTGFDSFKVYPEPCAEHDYKYTNNGSNHITHCDVCQYVSLEEHNYTSTYTDAYGVRTYNSKICKDCGNKADDNAEYTYDIGYTVDAEGNKTEKAPLLVLTPGYLDAYTSGYNNMSKGAVSEEDGVSYITFHSGDNANAEGNFYLFKGTDNPFGVTGQYLAIKYRTTCADATQFYFGANNSGATTAQGSDNCFVASGYDKSLIANGEWQLMIIDLNKLASLYFKAETEGDDIGKFKADYIRWDMFNTASATARSYDVAYIAMSDDIMSLASFDGNDLYRVCDTVKINSTEGRTYACATYMASAKSGNLAFDAEWILSGKYTGNSVGAISKDQNNGSLSYVATTTTTTTASGDNNVQLMGGWNDTNMPNYGKFAPTPEGTKYVAVMYRNYNSNNYFQWYINSSDNAKPASKIDVKNIPSDGEWHFLITDISSLIDTSKGVSCVRFDYHNNEFTCEIGAKLTDIAFIAFFTSEEEAYKYLGEYAKTYLVDGEGCQHDISAKSTEDCCTYCVYCGEQIKGVEHGASFVDTADGCKVKCSDCKAVIGEVQHTAGDYYRKPGNPQYELADCSACGAKVIDTRLADTTLNGLTIFTPDELMVLPNGSNGTYTREIVEENGLRFFRATSTDAGEGAIKLNGDDALMGIGPYVAIMVRKIGTAGGQIECWTSSADNSGSGNAVHPKLNLTNDGSWQLLIVDASSVLDENVGAGWSRIDMIDGTKAIGDMVDVAWVGFFNSEAEAKEMYDSYMKIFICTHSDQSELENIRPIKTEGSVVTAIADCTACDKKDVRVIYNTEDLKHFTADDLFYYYHTTGWANRAYEYATYKVVKENGISYIQYSVTTTGEISILLNSGTETLLPEGNYFAVLYRRSTTSGTSSSTDKLQLLTTQAGTTNSSGAQTINFKESSRDGEWKIEIIDLNSNSTVAGWVTNGFGWTKLDIFNDNVAVGNTIDIAYAGFFNSEADAQAMFASYMSIYSCSHSDHTKLNNIRYNSEEGSVRTAIANCTACGRDNVEVVIYTDNLKMFTVSDFYDMRTIASSWKHNAYNGTDSTYQLKFDENGMAYMHFTSPKTSDVCVLLNDGTQDLTQVGEYFVVLCRRSTTSGPNANASSRIELFVTDAGTTTAGSVHPEATQSYALDGEWHLEIVDLTGKVSDKGLGWTRLDFYDTKLAGSTIDIAYAGFFSSEADAQAYYEAYMAMYSAGN